MKRATGSVEKERTRWNWPIDINGYDRSPGLSHEEQSGLTALLGLHWHGQYNRPPWRTQLQRLLDPLLDSLCFMGAGTNERAAVLRLLFHEMERTHRSFWKWAPREWTQNLIEPTSTTTCTGQNSGIMRARPYLIALPVILRRITDVRGIGHFDCQSLACKVFGPLIEAELDHISKTLMAWGYASRLADNRERHCLCEALILNGSPYIEDLSLDLLKELHATSATRERRYAFQRISRALCSMGTLSGAIQHGFDKAHGGTALDGKAGISETWQQFVTRWRETSTSSVQGRSVTYYLLMKAGRWVTQIHPGLASPECWTRETAAAYVAAVCRMKVGDWTVHVNCPSDRGKPLTPRAMAGSLTAVRVFFRDCQEWEWIPRRFDPQRCLRVPTSVSARMGPDPRIIADDVWAKLLWAGLNLEPSDLSADGVHFLFAYRARQLSERYLNRVLIRALCTKAGVPRWDARGAITSHRGRATIASQLYNAKEPLSLFELQEWMGHRSPQSTQFYAKISATKLAKSYEQAGYFERNLHAIDVLIDRDAVRAGLVEGEPWKFYDLGHGYCSYDFFDQCPHRMACAKCSFYARRRRLKGTC